MTHAESSFKRNVVAIIQARMSSTRLPRKVMASILKRPLLSFLLERVSRAARVDKVIVATTIDPSDDPLVAWCERAKVAYFRGSLEDVLSRYLAAATHHRADVIVRICSDCPLIDPAIIDEVIERYFASQADYASNTLQRTYPRGMDVEVFSYDTLVKTEKAAMFAGEREHVTPYIYRHPELFRLHGVQQAKDESHLRLTVDTKEDLQLISLLLEALYPTHPNFTLADIMACLREHPTWMHINAAIQQKKLIL